MKFSLFKRSPKDCLHIYYKANFKKYIPMTLRFRSTAVDYITILRGIACLIIIAIHSPLPNTLIHSQVGVFLTAIGHMAIRLFFFLSGFVLSKGYLAGRYNLSAKGIFAFYGKRVRKIVPLYYLTTLYLFVLTLQNRPRRASQTCFICLHLPQRLNLHFIPVATYGLFQH